METSEALKSLSTLYGNQDWYADVGLDQYGRYVVYVKWLTEDILANTVDNIEGKQVLLHFVGSQTAKKEDFITNGSRPFAPSVPVVPDTLEDLSLVVSADLSVLTDELDRLEKIQGSNILQDIFYEIHDGKNAVTNLSAKFPEVRNPLEKLYNDYGFDVIYEELDG